MVYRFLYQDEIGKVSHVQGMPNISKAVVMSLIPEGCMWTEIDETFSMESISHGELVEILPGIIQFQTNQEKQLTAHLDTFRKQRIELLIKLDTLQLIAMSKKDDDVLEHLYKIKQQLRDHPKEFKLDSTLIEEITNELGI